MINLKTEQLKNSLRNILSNSDLPLSNIYYVLKDVFNDVTIMYNNILETELKDNIKDAEDKEEKIEE